jgi:hypothetical protein
MKILEYTEEIKRVSEFGFEHPLLSNILKDIKEGEDIACLRVEDLRKKGSFAGYIVYIWSDKWIYILDLAIVPELDEFKTKVEIIDKLITRTKRRHRICIVIDVREKDSVLQAALKNCGFKAKLVRDFFGSEDSFRMIYSVKGRNFSLKSLEREINSRLTT